MLNVDPYFQKHKIITEKGIRETSMKLAECIVIIGAICVPKTNNLGEKL